MKKIIITLIVLSMLFALGCEKSTNEEDTFGQEKAINISKPQILNMNKYKENNGRDLMVKNIIQNECSGCWMVEYQFLFDSDEGITKANVKVTLEEWEITDTIYGDEIISILGMQEAKDIAEGSECTEKGSLTEDYFYNENTKTWWFDLIMKPEFENELCNPACVVSEETEEAEINWRCTGALVE